MGIDNPVHIAFIAIVALVVLGPKRLPELARALGHGIREFREAVGQGAEQHPPAQRPAIMEPQPQPGVVQPAAPQPLVEQPAVVAHQPPPLPPGQPIERQPVDPAQQVRSGDAPDHRPL